MNHGGSSSSSHPSNVPSSSLQGAVVLTPEQVAGNPVKEESGGGMRDTIGGGVQDPVGGGVRDAIGGGVRDAIGGGVRDAIGGGHDQGARTAALSSHSIASFHNANSAPRSPNSKRSTIIWKSFDEARKCVSQLGLKNTKQWLIWSKSGQRPFDIPSNPGKRYPEFKERGGMPYWCGYTPPSTYGSGGHPGDNDIEASPQSEKRTQESSSPKAAQGQVPLHGGGHGFVNTKYGGKSSYTALGRPSHTQPGGLHRQIRCPDGTWSQWVLECGAKHRNAAIKEFNLSANETANLKQTSRRMKLLFAQRRYLARHVRDFAAAAAGGAGGGARKKDAGGGFGVGGQRLATAATEAAAGGGAAATEAAAGGGAATTEAGGGGGAAGATATAAAGKAAAAAHRRRPSWLDNRK